MARCIEEKKEEEEEEEGEEAWNDLGKSNTMIFDEYRCLSDLSSAGRKTKLMYF